MVACRLQFAASTLCWVHELIALARRNYFVREATDEFLMLPQPAQKCESKDGVMRNGVDNI